MISTTINGIRIASLCLLGYWLLLFAGTHIPRVHVPNVAGENNDKVLHVIAFAGLSFLLSWAIPTKMSDRFRNVRMAALCAILYGAFDELTQIPVGRTADWKDLIADTVGAILGIIAYCIAREMLWKIWPIKLQGPSTSEMEPAETGMSLQNQATR